MNQSLKTILFSLALLLAYLPCHAQNNLIAALRTGSAQKLDAFFTEGHEEHDHAQGWCGRSIWYYEILPGSKFKKAFAAYRYYYDQKNTLEWAYLSAIVDDKSIAVWRIRREKRIDELETDTSLNTMEEYDYEEVLKSTVKEYNNVEDIIYQSTIISDSVNCIVYPLFAKKFQMFYGVEFNRELNFITPIYGSVGLYGYLQNPHRTIMAIIQKKDTSSFEKWLRSGNVGLQFYAFCGFKQSGIKLSTSSRKLAKYILSHDVQMEYGRGCSSEMSTSLTIAKEEGFFDLLKK